MQQSQQILDLMRCIRQQEYQVKLKENELENQLSKVDHLIQDKLALQKIVHDFENQRSSLNTEIHVLRNQVDTMLQQKIKLDQDQLIVCPIYI